MEYFQQAIQNSSGMAIFSTDTTGLIKTFNIGAEFMLGYRAEAVIDKLTSWVFHDPDELLARARALSNTTNPEPTPALIFAKARFYLDDDHEWTFIREDGSRLPVWLSVTAIRDEQGEVVGYLEMALDITDRKRFETTLREKNAQLMASESNLRALIDNTNDSIWSVDLEYRLITVNQAFANAYQNSYGVALYPGINILENLPHSQAEFWQRHYDQALQGEQFSIEMAYPQGVFEITFNPIWIEEQQIGGVAVFARNIHERIEAENALQEANVALKQLYQEVQREKILLETILRNSPIATLMINADYEVTLWNVAAEKLFGYTVEQALNKNVYDLITTPDQRDVGESFAKSVLQGEVIHTIGQRKRADNTMVDVELFAVPITLDNEVPSALALYHDITELLMARRQAEAANQAKSQFLANMSHEIRTPLNAIIGMSGLLLDTPLTPDQREFAETTRTSSNALLSIVNDILDFSKIEAGKLELEYTTFNLYKSLEEAIDLVAGKATEKNLEVVYTVARGCPPYILGDAGRLRQILINLLNNAVKFTARGEIVISVNHRFLSTKEAQRFFHTLPDNPLKQSEVIDTDQFYEIQFSVEDTGIGIPPDRLNRLFQSFSQVDASTTRKYGGTGLGLAISKRLAEIMGGTMWVDSTPGVGSTFSFTIITTPALAETPLYVQSDQPNLIKRRILIVDDNSTNRRILMRQTRSWGMVPTVLASGVEALDWVRDGELFDVGILDMQMPHMDGLDLAQKIRQHSHFPLILLSSLGNTLPYVDKANFAAVLTKPTKLEELHQTVVDVIVDATATSTNTTDQSDGRTSIYDAEMATRYPLRILVTEDNRINQTVVVHILKKLGYLADVASDGLEAIEALSRYVYDVVLMDVQMPEMDGVEATVYIRQSLPAESQPYIVALTANALPGDREKYLSVGMDAYLSKPIEVEALIQVLQRVTEEKAHVPETALPMVSTIANCANKDGSAIVDLTNLMQVLDGDTALIQEFMDKFRELGPSLLAELQSALDEQDYKTIKRHAHSLKSNAALFCAVKLATLCQQLENATLDEEQFNQIAPLIADITDCFSEVDTALGMVP